MERGILRYAVHPALPPGVCEILLLPFRGPEQRVFHAREGVPILVDGVEVRGEATRGGPDPDGHASGREQEDVARRRVRRAGVLLRVGLPLEPHHPTGGPRASMTLDLGMDPNTDAGLPVPRTETIEIDPDLV